MEWRDEYCTGVGDVDRQHRYFFSLISSMDEESVARWSRDRLRGFLAEVQRFAHYHFRSEEFLMDVYGFDARDQHRAAHEQISARVAEFVADADKGTLQPAVLRQFLYEWFQDHTTVADRPLTEHVLRKQRAG